MNWPIYFKDNLIKGNPKSNIAICTLWLKKDLIAQEINPKAYSVIGNLYSKDGINYLLRNVLANPKIRFILLCGFDRAESGKALLNLKKDGINKEHNIMGSGFQLEREIDASAIDLFRGKVEIIDLIGKYDIDKITQQINRIDNNLPPFADQPLIFPEPQFVAKTCPSEEKAIVVRGNLVAEVWIKLLRLIVKFGLYDKTQYGMEQREIIDVVSVISEEDPDDIYFPNYFAFKKRELEGNPNENPSLPFVESLGKQPQKGYYSQVLTRFPLPDLSYTYGQRLLDFKGIDQINDIVNKLKQTKHTRRALAVLWNPEIDSKSENPPCLNLVQFRIINNKLLMTVYFRSHDIYGAWPQNAFALRRLQKVVADEVDKLPLGDLMIISHSAHIYKNDLDKAEKIIKRQYPKTEKKLRFERDLRGSFAIRVEKKKIIVNHYSLDGKHIQTFSGTKATGLSLQILNFISLASHAIYLGRELEKAEVALHTGVSYVQDEDIELGDIVQR